MTFLLFLGILLLLTLVTWHMERAQDMRYLRSLYFASILAWVGLALHSDLKFVVFHGQAALQMWVGIAGALYCCVLFVRAWYRIEWRGITSGTRY